MRLAALVLSLAFAVSAASGQTTPATADRSTLCTVSGRVVKAASGLQLKKARVTVRWGNGVETLSAISDEAGQFSIRGVPAGRVTVSAVRTGYLDDENGDGEGRVLVLEPGQVVQDLVLRMRTLGVITGRVVNEDGEGVSNATIEALRTTYSAGRRLLDVAQATVTDDRGEYRAFGLEPGRYYVRVKANTDSTADELGSLRIEPGDQSISTGTVVAFYPGTTELDNASTLAVTADNEVPGVDFSLQATTTHTVRGRIVGAPNNVDLTVVGLQPRDGAVRGGGTYLAAQINPNDNSFVIADVPAGSYTLSGIVRADQMSFSALQVVEVRETNVDDVALALALGVRVEGRVRREDGGPVDVASTMVTLRGENGSLISDVTLRVGSDGGFLFPNTSPGTYSIGVSGGCSDCFVKSMRTGESDVLGKSFEISAGAGPGLIEIVYSTRAGKLEGIVKNEDGSAAEGVFVALVPDEPLRRAFDRYVTTTADQNGRFQAGGVAPGNYKAFAWRKIQDREYEDADFLRASEGDAQAIEIKENEKKAVELKLIVGVAR